MLRKEYKFNDWAGPLKGLDKFIDDTHERACAKFGVDADGDCPVNVLVIDRTKYEPMHYSPVPYEHLAKTNEDMLVIEDRLLRNLETAMSQLLRFRRLQKDIKR